jgi:hypothetical protein
MPLDVTYEANEESVGDSSDIIKTVLSETNCL